MAKKKPAAKKGATGKRGAPAKKAAAKKAAAKKAASKKAAPARKKATAARKAAPARKKRAAAKKAPALLAEAMATAGGPAENTGRRPVVLVMTKSGADTMSTSGDVFSNTGQEASDIRVRRTVPGTLPLKPGPHKYVFKIEGGGSLTLEAQYPNGVTMSAPTEFTSDIPIGRVYDFMVHA